MDKQKCAINISALFETECLSISMNYCRIELNIIDIFYYQKNIFSLSRSVLHHRINVNLKDDVKISEASSRPITPK